MKRIFLMIPSIEDLKYRKMWLEDPKTMAYNSGLDLDIKGYNKNDGTISMTDEEMLEWYGKWINKEPDRYYAYIISVDEAGPIGEVYYYPDGEIHSMGILIYSKYRGKGYSILALQELEEAAFVRNNINELYDLIPENRTYAINLLKKAGFVESKKEIDKGMKQFVITKEIYYKNIGGMLWK